MSLEINKFLQDIFDSIVAVESHFQDTPTLSSYSNDLKTSDAVERRLQIIGEALWKADKLDKDLNITSKPKIIALRHILVHDYGIVDDNAIWIICKNHLPVLKNEVGALLNS